MNHRKRFTLGLLINVICLLGIEVLLWSWSFFLQAV